MRACWKGWKTRSSCSRRKPRRWIAAGSPPASSARRAAPGLKRGRGGLRTHPARRPSTLLEWRRLLTQLEERLQAVSILFHDVEDPLIDAASHDAPPAAPTEAAGWLERAAAVVAARQAELERLTGWMTRL